MATVDTPLRIRGRLIRVDEFGRVSLNDIHLAGGFSANQKPSDWQALANSKSFIVAVAAKKSGKSGLLSNTDMKSVFYVKRGAGGGYWADPIIALAFAKYLSPALHIEVNEIFLRYRAGDAVLADEVLQRASTEANEWAGTRALGRAARREYVDTLVSHDVTNQGIGACTNGIYQGLFNTTAAGLKQKLGVKTGTPRDKFSTAELAFTMAAEMLAKEDIEESNHRGDKPCRRASLDAARAIGDAITKNRDERRQGKLPL